MHRQYRDFSRGFGRISGYAGNRALRGFRPVKYKKHAVHVFYI
jgi:hypothetical protein